MRLAQKNCQQLCYESTRQPVQNTRTRGLSQQPLAAGSNLENRWASLPDMRTTNAWLGRPIQGRHASSQAHICLHPPTPHGERHAKHAFPLRLTSSMVIALPVAPLAFGFSGAGLAAAAAATSLTGGSGPSIEGMPAASRAYRQTCAQAVHQHVSLPKPIHLALANHLFPLAAQSLDPASAGFFVFITCPAGIAAQVPLSLPGRVKSCTCKWQQTNLVFF